MLQHRTESEYTSQGYPRNSPLLDAIAWRVVNSPEAKRLNEQMRAYVRQFQKAAPRE